MEPSVPESDRASLFRHPRSVPDQFLGIEANKSFQRSKSLQVGVSLARPHQHLPHPRYFELDCAALDLTVVFPPQPQSSFKSRRRRHVVCLWLLGAGVLVIAGGIIGGVVARKKAGSSSTAKVCSTESAASVTEFKQLPLPNSPQARALVEDPQTPGRLRGCGMLHTSMEDSHDLLFAWPVFILLIVCVHSRPMPPCTTCKCSFPLPPSLFAPSPSL